MLRSAAIVSLVGLAAWLLPATSAAGEKAVGPSKEAIEKAERAVKEHLEKIKGTTGQVQVLSRVASKAKDEEARLDQEEQKLDKEEQAAKANKDQEKLQQLYVRREKLNRDKDGLSLAQRFPDDVFINVRYRIYPIARQMPEGMKPSNVFVMGKNGKLLHLKDAGALLEFFKENQTGIKSAETARDALACWLILSQEFHQDGMFRFEVNKKNFAVEAADGGFKAIGRAVVMQGGNGDLNATVRFDNGKLAKVEETAKIIAGPRPICQATKLLDADPIVRRMAENDLLYLGDLVKDYLDEQRAQATPELRQAIDRIWQRIQQQRR